MKPTKKSLKRGSIYCKECDGTGELNIKYNNNEGNFKITCPMCYGNGQFDWIEQVVGKKTHKLGFFPDKHINMHPHTIIDYISKP